MDVFLKLESLQVTGSFKARAALLAVHALTEAERARGVVAVSAGNHAMAVAWAAKHGRSHAKVVMAEGADPSRIRGCEALGAEVVRVPDIHAGFARAQAIAAGEGRTFIHPFEGRTVALGTGTIALEMLEACPSLDAVVIPIGGGGLCGGMAAAIGQLAPACEVFGVEPEGADTMHRSFAAGTPMGIERVQTIADSLGAPMAEPYSFGLCRRFVTDLVRVSDTELCQAMALLYQGAKLVTEPAGAAATAAALGPLRSRLAGKKVGVVVCGANLHIDRFARYVASGLA